MWHGSNLQLLLLCILLAKSSDSVSCKDKTPLFKGPLSVKVFKSDDTGHITARDGIDKS